MWSGGNNVPQELIDKLCDDSIGCKEAGENDDFATESGKMFDILNERNPDED